jgi:hypothetical protein
MIKGTKIREISAIRLIRDSDLFPRVMLMIRNSNLIFFKMRIARKPYLVSIQLSPA